MSKPETINHICQEARSVQQTSGCLFTEICLLVLKAALQRWQYLHSSWNPIWLLLDYTSLPSYCQKRAPYICNSLEWVSLSRALCRLLVYKVVLTRKALSHISSKQENCFISAGRILQPLILLPKRGLTGRNQHPVVFAEAFLIAISLPSGLP